MNQLLSPREFDATDAWLEAPSHRRIAVFGGVYSNHIALRAALDDIVTRDVDGIYCLGDLGAFGPHPDRVFPLLLNYAVRTVRGNYDDSIGRAHADCQCGYTDPRDNRFAAISYRYTLARTSPRWRPYLLELPTHIRLRLGDHRVLMVHGSPRRTNEFLWESTTSTQFLERLADETGAQVILATHTGIKWSRALTAGRWFVNAGVIGRPENDGQTTVWYTLLEAGGAGGTLVSFVPVAYDHEALAREMEAEALPPEFVETIRTGWWTTCLEVLPARERKRGKY